MERDVVGGIAYEGADTLMRICDADRDGQLTRREMMEKFSHFAVPGGRGTGGKAGGNMGRGGGGRGGGMGGRGMGGRGATGVHKEL
jgi:hypothetical protein